MASRNFAARLLSSVSVVAFTTVLSVPALANPEGGKVVGGDATITATAPNEVTVDQATNKAIIEWNSFSIGANERTLFSQPSAASVALNRVIGDNPSAIFGQLKANGQIFLVNRNGILFGENARIDVAGLVASTADISNENFLAGRYEFDIPGAPGASVINLGELSIADQGLAALVAPHVRNNGLIVARLGKVALASGDGFTLDLHGDDKISLFVAEDDDQQMFGLDGTPITSLVENNGLISADGGFVVLTAAGARQAVNNVVTHDGVVEAKTIGRQNGQIVLGGDVDGNIIITGDIRATGENEGEHGGRITVTGENVAILGSARLDSSGSSGGGTVLIGGDYMGGNGDPNFVEAVGIELETVPIPTAKKTILGPDVEVAADAIDGGDGGKIIVWSDEETVSAAQLWARGGYHFGNGGFVETSGLYLDVSQSADVSAPNGDGGTWLLDPIDLVVENRDDRNTAFFDGFLFSLARSGENVFGREFFPTDEPSFIDRDTIEDALDNGTNVLVTTLFSFGSDDGDIEIRDDIIKRGGGDARLSFHAAGDIEVGRGVDFRSFSGRFDVELASFGGTIDADNLGRVDLRDGFFIVNAADGIDVSSDDEMPNMFVGVNLRQSNRSRVNVDIDFDDDQVRFSYTDETLTVPTGGIVLVDPQADSFIEIETFNGTSLALEDRAILYDSDSRNWSFTGLADAGATQGDSLNDVPEIIGGARFRVRPNEPRDRNIFPVIEVSDDEGLTVDTLIPTSPNGQLQVALIELEQRRQELEELIRREQAQQQRELEDQQQRRQAASDEVERVEDAEEQNDTINEEETEERIAFQTSPSPPQELVPDQMTLSEFKDLLREEFPGFQEDLSEHFQPEVVDAYFERLKSNWIKKEAFVQGAKLLVRAAFDPRVQRVIESFGIRSSDFMSDFFLGSFTDGLLNVGADVGASIIEDLVVETVRTWVVYDLIGEKAGVSEFWLPVIDTAFEEALFVFKTSAAARQGNAQEVAFELIEAAVRRYDQYQELVAVTNEITNTQERTFANIILEVDILVNLEQAGDKSNRRNFAEDGYNLARSQIVGGLYGSDDAEAVATVLEYTKSALEAEYSGDTDRAAVLTREMMSFARSSNNIDPFTLFYKPEDWFSALSSWGKDAPERAAIISVEMTPLSKYLR